MAVTRPPAIPLRFIAPCGLDCMLCRGRLRRGMPCPGCRGDDRQKMPSCVACTIRNCPTLVHTGIAYCHECADFPCILLKRLDRRYRTKYRTTPIGNLRFIRDHGVRRFIREDKARWTCPSCGRLRCMHLPDCPHCGDA